MKTKAALEAVEFAKQMQSGKMPITDENINKLCKLAGVKLYRNVDVTRRNGRMIPTRTRRTKEDSSYFSANTAAKLVGWSRGLFVRHVQNNVPRDDAGAWSDRTKAQATKNRVGFESVTEATVSGFNQRLTKQAIRQRLRFSSPGPFSFSGRCVPPKRQPLHPRCAAHSARRASFRKPDFTGLGTAITLHVGTIENSQPTTQTLEHEPKPQVDLFAPHCPPVRLFDNLRCLSHAEA
jgi:hypothetical protein